MNRFEKYNLTEDEFNALLKSQDYKCKICKTGLNTKSILRRKDNIDHCHETGKVRGILCQGCNIGLGGFKDNQESLKNAIEYLEHASSPKFSVLKSIYNHDLIYKNWRGKVESILRKHSPHIRLKRGYNIIFSKPNKFTITLNTSTCHKPPEVLNDGMTTYFIRPENIDLDVEQVVFDCIKAVSG